MVLFFIVLLCYCPSQGEFKVTERDYTMKEIVKALNEKRVCIFCKTTLRFYKTTKFYNQPIDNMCRHHQCRSNNDFSF